MGLGHLPKIATDGLVFMYDTGDGGKSYKGEPTTNLVTNPNFSTGDLTGWSSTSTSNSDVDIAGVFSENGYTYFHKKANKTVNSGLDRLIQSSFYTIDTSKQLTVSIDIWISPLNDYNITFYGRGTTVDDTTYDEKPLQNNGSTTSTVDLGGGWVRYIYTLQTDWYTGSGNTFLVAVYPDYNGRGLMEYKVRQVQVEQKSHATPFVNGTRSSTQGLLDRTRNSTIDLSDVSFDSNAQMTFDGTDDYADVSATDLFQPQNTTDGFTVEYVYRPEANTSVVPVGNLDSTNGWFQAPISNNDSNSLGAYLYFSTDGVVLSTGSSYAINSGIIGKYQHIVMVLKWSDTANSFIMLNGEDKTASKATASKYTVSGSANPALRIGKRGGSIWPANGQIPLVKIYNRALTAAEALQNFNATKSRFGI